MAKLHLWVGSFRTSKLFEKYLDQREYLAACAAYDHGLPGADASEPDPAARCAFCREVGLESFDEDALTMRYYAKPATRAQAARVLLVDEKALGALLQRHGVGEFNAVLSYQDARLSRKDAARASSVRYLGQMAQLDAAAESGARRVHHLWVGNDEVSRARVLETLGLERRQLVLLDVFRPAAGARLDDTLVTRVDDLFVAENMILKADRMKIGEARCVLHLVLDGAVKIDAEQLGAALGLGYIGRFHPA